MIKITLGKKSKVERVPAPEPAPEPPPKKKGKK